MRTCLLAIAVACVAGACTKHRNAGGWGGRRIDSVSGYVDDERGQTIAYTVGVPAGLGVDPDSRGGFVDYVANEPGASRLVAPIIHVGASAKRSTLDETLRDVRANDDDVVVRQQAAVDGFVIALHTDHGHGWTVATEKAAGTGALLCLAHQVSAPDEAELGDDSRELLERICTSLAAQ